MEPVCIEVRNVGAVSGLLQQPAKAVACLVLAHGAGAGMQHPFMSEVANGLHTRRIASLRFQFPYMEQGSRRPDRAPTAQATVRAAVQAARRCAPKLPIFAGGKSFGGRMTSQAQAEAPLPCVRGLVFLGFPLHAAGRPADTRADHLARVDITMLFLQGTRDRLADMSLLRPVIERLGDNATLKTIDQADHSFHCPVKSGRQHSGVLEEMLDALAAWMTKVL